MEGGTGIGRRVGVDVDFSACSMKALKWVVENIARDRDYLILVTVRPEAFYEGGQCSGRDIRISQSLVSTHGIPTFIVQLMNTCTAGCAPREIHLHCGEFVSARLLNPLVFKRISYDDCLVNGGKPLEAGQILRFAYYNTFKYPLAFKSAKFCHEAGAMQA